MVINLSLNRYQIPKDIYCFYDSRRTLLNTRISVYNIIPAIIKYTIVLNHCIVISVQLISFSALI